MTHHCTTHFVLAFKDEAGSHANAQLFPLGMAFFRSFQLRALPLRTLTLGVLIVSTGTLAALPFRRYQAIPDASASPQQVTGPAQSALDRPPWDPADVDRKSAPETSVASTIEANMVAVNLPAYTENLAPVAQSPAPRRERSVEIPLSYEDLAMPIESPVMLQKRFNATSHSRRAQLQRENVANLVMPAMESLALSQRQELERVAEAASSSDPPERKVAASLASAAGEQQTERLPEGERAERERYWIRQPN